MTQLHDYLTYSRACAAVGVDAIGHEHTMMSDAPESIRAYYRDGGTVAQQSRYYAWLTDSLGSK